MGLTYNLNYHTNNFVISTSMNRQFLILIFAAFTLWGCGSSMLVFSDFDKDANISTYNSYNWLSLDAIEAKGLNPLYYNEINDKRIKNEVDNQLKSRGFVSSNSSQPLELHYHIVVEDKTVTTTNYGGRHFNNYWLNRGVSTYNYREGTLIIDLMDTKNNILVWRGWATDVIDNNTTNNPEAAINKAVQEIFKVFPFTRK